MKTVLVQGASTAAGWYDMESGGWPNRLTLKTLPINEHHPQEAILIQNESVPGTTLSGILRDMPRIDRYQRLGRVTSVLAIGLNESKIRTGRNKPDVSLERFESDLQSYSEYVRSRQIASVYLGTELLLKDTIITEMGNIFESDLTAEYDELIRQRAQLDGMPYISMSAVLIEAGAERAVSSDGYHPNEIGHAAIATAVFDSLEQLGSFNSAGQPEGVHPLSV